MASFRLKNAHFLTFTSTPNLKMFLLHLIAEILRAPNRHTSLLRPGV